jgi:hypothetical protein
MTEKLLSYGICLQEQNETINKDNDSNHHADDFKVSVKQKHKANNSNLLEIKFYDESKQFDENFEDGSNVKYVLLPIFKDKNQEDKNYSKLLNAGSKVLLNRKKVMDKFSEGLNYFVVDYDPIFGLRLLSFEKYNSNFFSCEERVLFETLIIKFHLFKYNEFFYSYEVIRRELGIKKDRARTIIKKFISLGFLSCQVKTASIEDRPSQISYYNINANKVIELIPQIYISAHQEKAEEELTAYLEPAIKKQFKYNVHHPIDLSSIMQ